MKSGLNQEKGMRWKMKKTMICFKITLTFCVPFCLLLQQLDPNGFDTGTGSFDTDETRVFARLAEGGHPVPPCLLSYAVDATLDATPGRSFTERVSPALRCYGWKNSRSDSQGQKHELCLMVGRSVGSAGSKCCRRSQTKKRR